MYTFRANETFFYVESEEGAKGFLYPEGPIYNCTPLQDMQLERLPYVYLKDRSLKAFAVPSEIAKVMSLKINVIWLIE